VRPIAFIPLAAATLAAAGCLPSRAGRVSPDQAALVDQARLSIQQAAGGHDPAALLRHVAPGAIVTLAHDTLPLNETIQRLAASMGADSLRLWVVPRRLRTCDRWLYESGGQFGATSAGHPRYRYAAAWTIDEQGQAVLQALALVPGDFGGSPPMLAGCRPATAERFAPRRFGVSFLPGSGLTRNLVVGNVESSMRSRSYSPRAYAPPTGYPGSGSSAPFLGAVWYRVNRRLWLEGVATLGTSRASTFGADTADGLLLGTNFERKWAAALASVQLGWLRVGVGPAAMREAWHVATDEIQVGSGGQITHLGRIAEAGSTKNQIGAFTQVALTAPLSSRLFIDLRGWFLLAPSTTSPNAFGFAPVKAGESAGGIGMTFGAAF